MDQNDLDNLADYESDIVESRCFFYIELRRN